MGDRCYAEIVVRRSDQAAWEELGYQEEFEDDAMDAYAGTECVQLIDDERNYGVSGDPDDVVKGCPMVGWHSEGGDYPAMSFAYDGETFMETEQSRSGRAVVEYTLDGPDPDGVKHVMEFLKFHQRVMQTLGILPADPPSDE